MLKNKTIQVKLADAPKNDSDARPSKTPEDYVQIARTVGKDLGKGIGVLILTYVAADTLRQVTVQNTQFRK